MNRKQTWHSFVSLVVSLGLLLQTFAPLALIPVAAMGQSAAPAQVVTERGEEIGKAASIATEPAALTHPLTIARAQSRYQSGGAVTISYHIHNTLPPTHQPDVNLTTPFTDTVELLAQFPIEQDMNSLRDLALTTELAAGVTYLDSSFPPAQSGGTLTWDLADLLPGDTAVLTLTVQPPASAPDFRNLDNGAAATAVLWNSPVAASARPAQLAPDSVPAATLHATVDADLYDGDMLAATAVFLQDPLAIFDYAQGLAYEPYAGSLRGTRGTLWGAAGSSLDQSSFLIAALRAAGIPARYRHGALSVNDAQTLLASMFVARPGVAGYLPAGVATADPLNDPELLALAQDHWWVEAYLPGQGWTDLDPSFADAAVGQSFATPGSHDRSAEIPDELRHKLTLELVVEQYNSFPIGGVNLSTFVPLTGTIPIAQLAAKSLILGHVVETNNPGGLVFSTVEHTYAPYFGVNGDEFVLMGDSFQDLLTNFPLASTFTTAEWITISIHDIEGNSETFTREVKDLIGQGTRLLGGAIPALAVDAETPFITFGDSFVINVLPHHLRQFHLPERQQARLYYDLLDAASLVDALPRSGAVSPEERALAAQAFLRLEQTRTLLFALSGLEFARLADPVSDAMQESLGVKLYYDLPRLIVMQGTGLEENARRTMDLRNTTARAVAVPGQAATAVATAQWVKAVAESRFEGEALRDVTGATPITTWRIFNEAQAQGIEFAYITPDKFDLLALYLPDPAAYGYAAAALIAGREILIPQSPVLVDGQPRLGWWEIDPQSGAVIPVLEDGTHGALIEYGSMVAELVVEILNTWDDFGESVRQLWFDCIVDNVVPALNGGSGRAPAVLECAPDWSPPGGPPGLGRQVGAAAVAQPLGGAAPWYYLPDHLCPTDNCGLEQFVLPGSAPSPMPLPEIAFQYDIDRPTTALYAGQLLPVTDNGSGGSPAFSLTAVGSGTAVPQVPYAMSLSASANFNGELEVWSYVPPGWSVGYLGGQVQIVAPEGTAAGDYTILLVGQARHDRSLIATAQHIVTIPAQEALHLRAAVEPNITIPIGPATADPSNQTNDGQAEIPDSAFRIDLYNASHLPKSVQLTVSGAPAGWVVLNGRSQTAATLDLPAYEYTRAGLYILPPSLPAPGTSFTLEISASDGGSLSQTETIVWTMPGQAHNFLEVPAVLFAESSGSVDFDLVMSNVGNAAGSFPIAVTTPLTTATIANLQSPISLAPGQSDAQTPTLQVGAAAVLGRRYPIQFSSPAPDSYTQYAFTELQIVSPESGRLFAAANSCTLNDSLGASLEALALAVVELEYWCSAGDCPLPLRDRAAAAGQSVVSGATIAAASTILPALSGVETAVAALSTATNNNDILTAVSDLSLAVESLSENLCELEQHRVNGRFTPYVQAILLGDSASFSLDVTNQGTLTTSYAITLTGLPGGDLLFNETIPPGATVNLSVTPTPNVLGNFNLTAEIVADVAGEVDVRKTAVARLNVVDKFVQVTQVIADPPFVETGVSSTTLSVEVANFAGVGLASVAETAVFAPDGSQQFNTAVSLTILAGNPRVYELTGVDTSGWSEGVYTVTVNLLDAANNLIPDGSGYGYFSVGQALQLSQAVMPEIVAPGTVTVTTIITSEIAGNQLSVLGDQSTTIYDAPLTAADLAYLNPEIPNETPTGEAGLAPALAGQPQTGQPEEEQPQQTDEITLPLTPVYSDTEETADHSPFTIYNSLFTILNFPPAFSRVEQNDPAWTTTGTWTNVTLARASGGSHWRNNVAGSTAELTFDGTWVNLGFIGDRWGGYAQITIDGNSYGVIDLYRRDETPISFTFDGLSNGAHTLTIEVLGSGNPFATLFRVQLDYADYGDGSALPHGSFEQNDLRLIKSSNWFTNTYSGASGGSYIRTTLGTAWFPFDGDSFSLQTIAYSSGGRAQLFVDGAYLDTIDLFYPVFASSAITRTFAYEGLGAGPHVLQVMAYQDTTTIDKLTTPGQAPFIDPNPPVSGVTRFEADHPSILYNGFPFTQTAVSWVRVNNINANRASAGEYIYSDAVNDVISFDFEGEWLGVGFVTDRFGGQAEIAIDGQPVATVDLYGRYDDTASYTFRDLGAGAHTVTITVLDTSHPNSLGSRVTLDFFDVWDGQPLAEGVFEEDDADYNNGRLVYSNGWSRTLNAGASGGAYANSTANVTAWFPFTGDSVTYQGWTNLGYDRVEIRLNGVSQGKFDIYSYADGPRTYSFDNLGPGPHVMEIRQYRATVTLDAFITPAVEPGYEPPAPSPIFRYEEDHPALRYNGHPFTATSQSWVLQGGGAPWRSSGSNNMTSSTAGDVWSLDFEGQWLNVGFRSTASSGTVEIFIDGASQGLFATANGINEVKSFTFGDLSPGAHTVAVVIISGTVLPDYMDVWDGQPLNDGWYDAQLEEDNGRFHFSIKSWWRRMDNIYAYNGDYLTNFTSAFNNIWFTFIGTDLTVLGHNRANTELHIVIDGVYQGVFDMTPQFSEQPFALHFPDLGEGPHVIQVYLPSAGHSTARLDAFEVNPADFNSYTPLVEWYDFSPQEVLTGTGTGLLSSIALGDLDGDGIVELVAPANNGRLYVYRGDGQDAGNGLPLLWSSDLVGQAAEPALADLSNDGKAEIVVSGANGTAAFTHAGNILWYRPDIVSYYSGQSLAWGGPSIGNLDLDPEPEIVIAASEDALYVLDHEGNTLFSDPIGRWPTVPVLSDITGDGILDIIVAREWELKVYDYFNGGQIVWTYVQTDTVNHLGGQGAFGAPAIADLTGDGQPEIIINWGHLIEALRDDGTVLWRYHTNNTNLFRPSAITVADVTGDGQMNIVTASAISAGFNVFDHLLLVLDADGNLVWQQTVADNSASASGVAAQDLTGNGVWEILWNGATDGFLVIRGSDGKRLFNEPVTGSGTVLDYPTLGDVDGDGYAEVIVGGREGIFVFGHDGRWADSRPLWNQHNYHVTNINDDWSIPINEPNSWELHNTYRTQTPDRSPAPAYQMVFTYTEGSPNVTVLTNTTSISLTAVPPIYSWDYRQEWYQPLITTTFDSLLTGMQPGETRQVSAGTEVAYRLPSGFNTLTLPPLYVIAPGLGELAPTAQSVVVGGTAVFTLTLTNPGNDTAVYTLNPGGIPAEWLDYPSTVPISAGATAVIPILVNTPPNANPDTLTLWLDVEDGSGGLDDFSAQLTVFDGLALALTPLSQTGATGQPLTYTLTISNLETVARTYGLTAVGLADVTLSNEVTILGNGAEMVMVTAVPPSHGPQPFTIAANAASGASDSVDGVAVGDGRFGILAAFNPDTVVTGPGATAVYTLTLTNVGDTADSYTLNLDVPVGWTAELTRYGVPITEIALPALLYNSAELRLLLTPATAAQPGSYPLTLTAQSLSQPGVIGTAAAIAEITARGVTVAISPANQTVDPTTPTTWDVTVTNTGSVADAFDLTVSGAPALAGTLSANSVTLAPGAAQTVQLTAADLGFLLPGSQSFAVMAQSQADGQIRAEGQANFTVAGFEAASVTWLPESRTVTNTLTAGLTFVISNTGNVLTEYEVTFAGTGVTAVSDTTSILIPPRGTAVFLVQVTASGTGSYQLLGTATSANSSSSATANLTFLFDGENQPPEANAGPDQLVGVDQLVQFNGSAIDPDGDDIVSIEWDFGDGHTAVGTFTPTHRYATADVYTVTLTVTDSRGGVGAATVTVTVKEMLYLPLITRGP